MQPDITIKTLVEKARRHRRHAREHFKHGLIGTSNWHEGMSEAYMNSARIVKHDTYQALDS